MDRDTELVRKLREAGDEADAYQLVLDYLEDAEEHAEPPDTSSLFNRYMPVDKVGKNDGKVCINGEWVHPFFLKITNQLAKGESPIILVVGKEGLGKSLAGVHIAHTLHDRINALRGEFIPEEQVVYEVIPFLALYCTAKRTVVMMDEANETINKVDYMSDLNTSVAKTLRTQRIRQNVNLIVGPEYGELDPRVRRKADVIVELKGKQYADVEVWQLRHGRNIGKRRAAYFMRLPGWRIPDIPDGLREAYEEIDRWKKDQIMREETKERIRDRLEELDGGNRRRVT